MTTKRLTYRAAEDVLELARIQAKLKAHRRQIAQLEQAERNLKGRLPDYFEKGDTDLEYQDGTVAHISYSTTERLVMDGDKIALFYARQGKPVPLKKVDILYFGVRAQ